MAHVGLAALAVALATLTACSAPDQGALEARRPDISFGTPEQVGMSSEALSRIAPAMEGLIDERQTGGIVTLIARDGVVVHWDAYGWRLLDGDPLERDDVFRIYSMTKPVTSVAVMMLVEDGLLELDQPLAEVLPAFAEVQVYDGGALRPPSRPVTIRDLLRHTSGLTYGVFSDTPVDRMYVERLNALSVHSGRDLAETVDVVASLPLLADPGTLWHYSMSTDVLGRVVEVTSGLTLADFFRTRIFEPLDMDDTGFHVAEEDLDRLTAVYSSVDGVLVESDSPVDGPFTRPPSWYSGGGGLTSTPSDYLRFSQMLLNEGELDGVRLLRPRTVRLMTRNHLDEALMPIQIGGFVPQDGFGLGFAVTVDGPAEGTYSWGGAASTWFWIDPVEEIVAFVWTQYMPMGAVRPDQPVREILPDAVVESNRVPSPEVESRAETSVSGLDGEMKMVATSPAVSARPTASLLPDRLDRTLLGSDDPVPPGANSPSSPESRRLTVSGRWTGWKPARRVRPAQRLPVWGVAGAINPTFEPIAVSPPS